MARHRSTVSRSLPLRPLVIAGILLIGLLGGAPAALAAPNSAVNAAVRELFDKYWDARTSDDQQAGDDAYLRQSARLLDWRHQYAQALVQIAQYRTADARETMRLVLKANSDDWRLHRTRAWTCLASRSYETALPAMDAWLKSLPAPAKPKDLDGLEAAADLGAMFGFLETAAHKPIDAGTRDRYLRRWQLLLTKDRRAAFDQGRERVKRQHDELIGKRDRTVREDEQQAVKEKEAKLVSLDRQQDALARERDELGKTIDSLRDQLRSEMAALERQDAPLRVGIARLDAQAVTMNRDLAVLSSDIASLQRRLRRERDPLIRARLRDDILRLDAIAARRDAELLGVERELDQLAARRQALLLRQRQVQADVGGDIQRSTSRLDALAKSDRRLGAQRQRVLRDTPEISGGARAMAARARIIATYMTFPLVEERQRLLALTE